MESRLNWLMICAMVSLCDSSDKITPTSGTSNFSCRRKSASRKRTRKICVNDIYNVLVKFLYSPTRRQVSFMTLSDAKLILTKENARITDVNWHQVTPADINWKSFVHKYQLRSQGLTYVRNRWLTVCVVACVMNDFATGDQSWNVIKAAVAQTSRQIN